MNKFSALLVCALIATVASEPIRKRRLQVRAPIAIEYCVDGTAEYLPSVSVDVEPYPIHIATGGTIDIHATIELGKAIEAGSKLELKLTKTGIIDIVIPCLDLGADIPIGSCEYDGSMILQLAQICPQYCPEGQVSDLPLNPGTYGGTEGLHIDLPEIPSILEPFLKGKIEVFGRVKGADGAENICVTTVLELD